MINLGLTNIRVESDEVKVFKVKNKISIIFRKNKLKNKLFKTIFLHSEKTKNFKESINILSQLTKTYYQKQYFMARVKNIYSREIILNDVLNKYDQRYRLLSILTSLNSLKDYTADFKNKLQIADNLCFTYQKNALKKIMTSWKQMILRKKQSITKGEEFKASLDLQLIKKMIFIWKSRVLDNQDSIFQRQNMLKSAINKLHILRVFDTLRDFRDNRLEKKALIAEITAILEIWIYKRLTASSFLHMKKVIEYEDSRDFFLETTTTVVNRAITRNGFNVFISSIKQAVHLSMYCEEFEEYRLKKKIKSSLKIWQKVAILNKKKVYFDEEIRQKNIVIRAFNMMKEASILDENSLYQREKILGENLVNLRKIRVLKQLKTRVKMMKFRKERTKRIASRLLDALEMSYSKKKNIVFKKMSFRLNLEKSICNVPYQYLTSSRLRISSKKSSLSTASTI